MFGLFEQKKETDPARFWKEYEEKCGEQVLAYTLGQYLSGWDDFNLSRRESLWGLLIATSGGFRFHHFPHEGWIQALSRVSSGGEAPKEQTLFIPKDQLTSVELRMEKSLLKKLFFPSSPRLVIRYGDAGGELVMETDQKAREIVMALSW
ncbi:MAG: hypothetical protein LBU28_03335 [Spirochaetaceae bacterium]|jgi:hypothetical protein|nr:hypothetical protein [Spirochaetaceae bacterium]